MKGHLEVDHGAELGRRAVYLWLSSLVAARRGYQVPTGNRTALSTHALAGEQVRRLAVGMEAAMESGEFAAIQILDRA